MRIFIGFFVMGAIAVTVAVIVVAEMLVAMLPLLAVVVAALAILRLTQRRRGPGSVGQLTMARSNQSIPRPLTQFGPPAPRVAGWVIVPISLVPIEAPRPLVIDGYIVGKDAGNRRD